MLINGLSPHELFEAQRNYLFRAAYRMLGTVSDAEDMVQETYLRWQALDHASIENSRAYLIRITVRLCLDYLKSAQHQRTDYIGPWLPEPLLTTNQTAPDPSDLAELAEDLSFAFVFMLERLTPTQRAVFLLHDTFGFNYTEIATMLQLTPDNCRQLGRRARQKLTTEQEPFDSDPAEHERLFTQFMQAIEYGDVEGMVTLLAEDAILYSDGGGKVTAARQPIYGAERIIRFLNGVSRHAIGQIELRPHRINGRSAMLVYVDGSLNSCWNIAVSAGQVARMYIVLNPDKLAHAKLS